MIFENTFYFATWYNLFYFIVLMLSFLFCTIENGKNKDKPLNEHMCPNLPKIMFFLCASFKCCFLCFPVCEHVSCLKVQCCELLQTHRPAKRLFISDIFTVSFPSCSAPCYFSFCYSYTVFLTRDRIVGTINCIVLFIN